MAYRRSPLRILIYLFATIIAPMALMIINHVYWIDNIVLTIFLITWMGFGLIVLQPYSVEGYETIEP
ncbi:MAG: hypothetical protein R6U17_05100 [Thermoplasmata archaeon]